MEILVGKDGSISIAKESYAAWPAFKVQGVDRLGGRLNCKHLKWLIEAVDLFCDAWQRKIPIDVLNELRRYPGGHAELIELAQLDQQKFVCLSRSNPALTAMISAYWIAYGWRRIPSVSERNVRLTELLGLKPRLILQALGLPASDEWVRILGKIPIEHCRDYHIRHVIELCNDRKLRRRLRHLPTIAPEVSWLLRMERPILDMPTLELAAKEPENYGLSLTDIVASIVTKREMAALEPVWPYGGTVRTWEQLLRAEKRNAKKCGDVSEQLPLPPVPLANLPDGLAITPLSTPLMVEDEASEMDNCVVDYLKSIQLGEHYLYRMEAPVRASVLIRRGRFCWELEEIGLPENEGEVDEEIERLITRWISANYESHKRG